MSWRKAIGIVLVFWGIGLVVWAAVKWGSWSEPLMSPLSEIRGQRSGVSNWKSQIGGERKIVTGFLPYWNFKYEPAIQYGKLTHLAFFGLNVNGDGTIQKREKQGNLEPGWTAYQSAKMGEIVRKTHDNGAKVILVLRAFDNQTIESVLSSPARREKLIGETLEAVKTKNLDGVNIDFEYVGTATSEMRNEFVEFVRSLRARPSDSFHLSIDTYADAADNDRIWDITALGEIADYIVIMGYDFTRPNSDYSGPVAPLHYIKEAVAAYSKIVPLEKLVLGVPYYGYEWPTLSKEPISKTTDAGYLATYKRIQELILGAGSQLGWDSESFTPYLISTESGKTTQVFYDDTRSLGLKYDLVNETGMAGAAIWALGYEGEHPELWKLLEEKFGR